MTEIDSELAPLCRSTLSSYLMRLGVSPPSRLDLDALTTLQTAHLRAVPFHNLELLAAAGRDPGLPAVSVAIERAVRGHGGTCHVLSPPFAVLLRSLGFDAHLAAAAVGAPGDHLVVIVHMGGRRWLCDVANGHPYLKPFPLDMNGEEAVGQAPVVHFQTAYGWQFRIEPLPAQAAATHRVLRLLPDGTWKVVYTVDPAPVPYATFERIIVEHHTRAGFGPFLTGLRAVRMTQDRLLCLRDCWLERYGVGPPGRRFIPSAEAVGEVLSRHFGLNDLPWRDALRTLAPQTKKWWLPHSTVENETPKSSAIRLLLSVGLTDRPGSLWALGQGLLRDGLGTQNGASPAGILAFENSNDEACIRDNQAAAAALATAGLPTQIGDPKQVIGVQKRLLAAGLCAAFPRQGRVDIATSRMIQVGLLANFFEQPSAALPRLPHPSDGQGSVAVWMLDDDLRLERLEATARGLACTPLSALRGTLDRLYRQHPEVSVLIGGNTGCPPLPGFCFLYVQILDLIAHIESASRSNPDALYVPLSQVQQNPRHLLDYYYDTSESGDSHLHLAFAWEPDAQLGNLSTRAALLAHLRSFSDLLHGQPSTRLLIHQPDRPLSATTARGGNAIFFDLDALFAAPYLAVQLLDKVVSRRGDTVWAHLATAVPGISVFTAPFPVHHTRSAKDGSGPALTMPADDSNLRHFILAQIGGVALSRLVAAQLRGQALDPLTVLQQRAIRVRTLFAAARKQIDTFESANYATRTNPWWSRTEEVAVRSELTRTAEFLTRLRTGVLSSEVATAAELETVAENLAAALAKLPETAAHWRSLWS